MDGENIFKIHLKILDKYYPYNCRRSEEKIVRKAAKNFTEKFLKYSCEYPSMEKMDLLVLEGFHFALETLKNEEKQNVLPVLNEIQRLSKILEEYLNISK